MAREPGDLLVKITKGELQHGRFIIPYRVYGEADKVLVCVSGAQQTMAVWKPVVCYFSSEYSVVVFDSPGQGRSRLLYGAPVISLDEQVEALHAVISATHRYTPLHLAAASWGTMVASAYAARHPGTVEKMVLASFGVKPSQAMLEVINEGQKLYKQDRGPEIAHLMIQRFGSQIPPSYQRRIIEQFRHMTEEQFQCFYAHCDFVQGAGHIKNFVDLQNIKAKTLIINGEHDTILDLEDVSFAMDRIPNCEARIVPGVGHFLHFEREGILPIYKEFLLNGNGSAGTRSPSPELCEPR